MAFWSIDLRSLDGTSLVQAAAPFASAQIKWTLEGPGAAEITLAPNDISSNWLYGQRRVLIKDGAGTSRYQGWLDRLDRSGKPSDIRYRASSRGLAAILFQRAVHGDFPQVATVATTIARALITHMVAQTDDKTAFTLGSVTGTAPSRSRWYCDGDNIGDAINDLAQMDSGFAWEISATGAFNCWVGGRGSDLSGTKTVAPADTIEWNCTADVTELGTYVTGLGDTDDEEPCGPPLVVDFSALRTTYGRREFVISADTRTAGEILEKTTEELRARGASRINLRTSWVEGGGPWAFGAVWVGDLVNAVLGAEFGGTLKVRCIGIMVTLEPGKHEFIEMEWELQ